ncbi:MAG: FmdB family transcriptional regulator [Promicromonosporaceae bacterium]|nr:FmdB family transcriptional regulator [Promicromonosporaceae bacterium]
MPTYAYRCSDCGHGFDIRQSFSDDALTVCPQCDGRLHKEYGSVGITFKGSGFYRTDSRSGSSVPSTPKKPGVPSSSETPKAKPASETKSTAPQP